jgi:hypothetical protein
MEVIQGGFKEGVWLHDRNFYSEEEIEDGNEWFRQLTNRYPQYFSWLMDYVWDIKPKSKTNLITVK